MVHSYSTSVRKLLSALIIKSILEQSEKLQVS